MKHLKYIWSFVLLLLATNMAAQTKAVDQVILKVTTGSDSTTWNVDVNLENAKSGNYTAFQMDLTLPDGFVVRDKSWEKGFRIADHQLSVQQLSGSKYRILGYSATNEKIKDRTGKLLSLTVDSVVNVVPEKGYSIKLTEVIFTRRDGNEVTDVKAPLTRLFSLTYLLDGERYGYQVVQEGAPLTMPTPDPKKGHTFSGWSSTPKVMPARNLQIKGSYRVNQYDVVYEIDGEPYQTIAQDYGTKIELPEPPVREGYTFQGWSEVPETMPDHKVLVTGHFEVNIYTITYILDGKEYGKQQVAYGEKIDPLTVENTEEQEFQGWQNIPATMPAGDLVIYGQTVPTGIEEITGDTLITVYNLQGKLVVTGCTWEAAQKVLHPGVYVVNGKLFVL